MKKPATPQLMLGPVAITSGQDAVTRMAVMIWGPATAGKTTFAATAPGVKLWLSFGDNEHVSVASRPDVRVANLSQLSLDELFKHARSDNPFGLDQLLADNTEIETVVVDSATAIAYRSLQQAVATGVGAGRGFVPTLEAPGISAYGGRNAIMLQILTGILRVTDKHNVHCIFTAHEGDAVTTKDNTGKEVIDYITIMLGGQLVNNMTWRLSEIWHLSQSALGKKERRLAVRPAMNRRPMKSRMFSNKSPAQFTLTYDSDQADDAKGQMTIAAWYNEWRDSGGKKITITEKGQDNGA